MESKIESLNNPEGFKKVSLRPVISFESKVNPIFESEIFDSKTQEVVGRLEFSLNQKREIIHIPSIFIKKPREGYGISVYKKIQEMYPEYTLQSSEQMNKKDDKMQEKPNAVYLWEKLESLGLAEKRGETFFMKKS